MLLVNTYLCHLLLLLLSFVHLTITLVMHINTILGNYPTLNTKDKNMWISLIKEPETLYLGNITCDVMTYIEICVIFYFFLFIFCKIFQRRII